MNAHAAYATTTQVLLWLKWMLLPVRTLAVKLMAARTRRKIPLSFLILCLGFLGILLGDQRRALHDIIAGTVVIYCWDARAARLRLLSRPRYSAPHAPPESGSLPGPPGQADPAS